MQGFIEEQQQNFEYGALLVLMVYRFWRFRWFYGSPLQKCILRMNGKGHVSFFGEWIEWVWGWVVRGDATIIVVQFLCDTYTF